jgi:hypothetical protein
VGDPYPGIGIGCEVTMEAFALGMVVHRTASRSCTTAVSEADCGFDAGCVRWHEL